jgi:hypothetical protein
MPRILQGAGAKGGFLFPLTGFSTYVGPGDLGLGTPLFWIGLRAFSLATVSTKAVNIRRSSDNTSADFNTLSNGDLDVASITAFVGGSASAWITKLYDKSGNGNDFSQTVAANQPQFIFPNTASTAPLAKSTMFFSQGFNSFMSSPSIAAQIQPFFASMIFNNVDIGSQTWILDDASLNIGCGVHSSAANQAWMWAGNTIVTASQTDSVWHAMQVVWNNTTSDLYIDGVTNPLSVASTTGSSTGSWTLGDLSGTGGGFNGYGEEFGVWLFAPTSGQKSSLNSNQHAYGGF